MRKHMYIIHFVCSKMYAVQYKGAIVSMCGSREMAIDSAINFIINEKIV